MPRDLKDRAVPRGEMVTKSADGINILKWKDKRDVYMISTLHRPVMQNLVPRAFAPDEQRQKPNVILDYNINKVGVDKNDQLCSYNPLERKVSKWYKKLFWRLVTMCVVNAHVVYKKVTNRDVDQKPFRLALIKQLLLAGQGRIPHQNPGRQPVDQQVQRLLPGNHFPIYIPPTPNKHHPTKRCTVCSGLGEDKTRRETAYMCELCEKPLCIVPCFGLFHKYQDYKQAWQTREQRQHEA